MDHCCCLEGIIFAGKKASGKLQKLGSAAGGGGVVKPGGRDWPDKWSGKIPDEDEHVV